MEAAKFGELIIVPDCTLENESLLKVVISTVSVFQSRFLSSIRGQRLDLMNFLLFFYLPTGSLLQRKKSVKQKINLVWPKYAWDLIVSPLNPYHLFTGGGLALARCCWL